jgi:TrmH RNA methyltransferase
MERLPLGPCLLLLLDGVSNPHNLGALLRTAAHYGALAVLGREGELPGASPAVHRVSEGGAEWVGLCPLTRLDRELDRLLKVGFGLVGAQPGAAEAMHRAELPARMILALGAEGPGLSPALLGRCRALGLPGTGAVQSLNVGVAGALGMGLWWARHGAA